MVFLSPFDWLVWSLIVAFGFTTSVLTKYFFQVENRFNMNMSPGNESTYSNSFLMVFGIFFQQGNIFEHLMKIGIEVCITITTDYEGVPLLISTRIFTLTTLTFSVFIFQFYGSFIVGSLLTETPKTIKTMKQLMHSGLDFAIDEFPYVQDVFAHSQEESAITLYNKIMAQPKPLLNVFAGLDLVKKGSLAFNTDGIYAYAILKS